MVLLLLIVTQNYPSQKAVKTYADTKLAQMHVWTFVSGLNTTYIGAVLAVVLT